MPERKWLKPVILSLAVLLVALLGLLLLYQSRRAFVIVTTDSDCTVAVNDKRFLMRAGDKRRVSAEPGDNVITATSRRNRIAWKQLVKVDAGTQKIVEIDLHDHSMMNARDELPYVWIPAGTFTMGCSNCYNDNQKPQHSVTITDGFWFGQTPVTDAAYQRVMSKSSADLEGDEQKVKIVQWQQANAYCSALGMRLPTEAEWEYAARTGTANNYATDSTYSYSEHIQEVAQKQSNAWDIYDMGNFLEWTADWYDEHYYTQSPSQNPQGPASGEYRVVRGSSSLTEREGSYSEHGFRCAGETVPKFP